MNVSDATDDNTNDTNSINDNNDNNDNTNNKPLSSSPPSTPPSAEPVDAHPLEEHLTSSPDRRTDIDEQPIIIPPEFLQPVIALVESLGPRRVKVYELRGEVWVDLGTGFCQGFVENVPSSSSFQLY